MIAVIQQKRAAKLDILRRTYPTLIEDMTGSISLQPWMIGNGLEVKTNVPPGIQVNPGLSGEDEARGSY